ncbi:MAG: hypothetical protein WBA97_03380 [Actinophytocola sp.]|uniref:hypothetical protein n=1 Tax=Actinophytocola sp. TaxID=1872138 RepID=UPI003C794128
MGMLALMLPITGGTAQASELPVSSKTTVQASCHYTVNGNNVAVRRAPDPNAHVIKYKDRGQHVHGPCVDYFNKRWWTQVHLGNGGTGWMASAYLVYNGYW